MHTRVKICGITRPEDGRLAAELGADAVGLVFYTRSPRVVTVEQARSIVERLPPFVCVVGLFVDERADVIRRVLDAVRIDLLQFHGAEEPAFCGGFGRPYIKAVPMHPGVDLKRQADLYTDALGLLLDSFRQGSAGGTGTAFDWSRVPADQEKPVILAGGLSPDNVAAAIRQVRPYAVDVSSGVEAAKGIKDAARMAAFMRQVSQSG